MKNFLPLIILSCLILLASLAVYKSNTKQNIGKLEISSNMEKSNLKLQKFSLQDIFDSKKNLSLDDIKNDNNKYSIINFFASWCSTCLAEHEILMKFKDTKFVNFYGIAWNDFSENTRAFLEKYGNPYQKIASDSKGIFSEMIGLKAVPETILVDADGSVIARFQGNLDEATMINILESIEYYTKK